MPTQTPSNDTVTDVSSLDSKLTVRFVEQTTLPRTREFTPEELREAFSRVQAPTHWKDPIDAEIDAADAELIDRAIAFMAYGGAEFHPLGNGKTRVTAPGYWGMEAILESPTVDQSEATPTRPSMRPR